MLDPGDYSSAPVATFLDAVARRESVPGGGAVAALTVAMAAALVAMAAAFAKDAPLDATSMRAEADLLRDRVVRLVGEDAKAYAAVLAAKRRPRDDPTRVTEIDSALIAASEVPLQVTRIGSRVNELARDIAERGNPNLRGDAYTAAHLAAAAARSAALLVRLNLSDPADPRVQEAEALAAGCADPS